MKIPIPNPGGRRGARAFTLADALMAVLVLATVGTAFCTAVSCGFIVLKNTREDVRATQILMQKLETVRLCTWSQLTNFTFQESYDPLNGTNQAGAVYFGSVVVGSATNIPSSLSYASNMAQVTVSLMWTNYNRGVAMPHSRQMATQVARNGLQSYLWGAIQ